MRHEELYYAPCDAIDGINSILSTTNIVKLRISFSITSAFPCAGLWGIDRTNKRAA